jgi:hypothetical protein
VNLSRGARDITATTSWFRESIAVNLIDFVATANSLIGLVVLVAAIAFVAWSAHDASR